MDLVQSRYRPQHRVAAEARDILAARESRLAYERMQARAARKARLLDWANVAGACACLAASAAIAVLLLRGLWQAARALFVVLVVLLCADVASAQFVAPKEPPPVCTVECPAGPHGPKGDPGPRGPKGDPGPPAVPPVVPPLPPFDLGVHGFHFLPGDLRVVNGRWMLLTYETTQKAAVLLDIATCVAQVHPHFDAGIGAPLTWGSVRWVTDADSVWWHAGALWSWRWNAASTVTLNLNAWRFDDPKLGKGTPLCRWRDQ